MIRTTFIALLAGSLLLCAGPVLAKDPPRPKCENCGMYTDTSSTHVVASIEIDGKTGDHEFVCPDCLHEKLEEWGDKAELKSFEVLDYNSFNSDAPKMIDGMKAWYLFDTEELEGSMPVYSAAFSSKDAAKAASKDLGGELVQGWDGLLGKIEAAEEAEADNADKGTAGGSTDTVYVCSCTGGCCDDITSDKPGLCPRCGMKLVPKDEK